MLLISFVRLTVTWIDGLHLVREENERRVKQVLVELGEDLRLLAEREVEELQLPMRDADIQRLCKQSQTRALQGSVSTSFFYYYCHKRQFSSCVKRSFIVAQTFAKSETKDDFSTMTGDLAGHDTT